MKKITTAVVAFALALTVVAPVAASAQTSASYTFNTNLTVGARGADVVALQSFLESKGVLTIPAGVAKGYFGAMTRSALAAYQSMKGIKPAAGYF
uniref:peptidoglycan-binding domain-containing protein n=1 Tax=Mesomycoplasma ovipneumoniae TaxID=29562 RepID=UPI003080795A